MNTVAFIVLAALVVAGAGAAVTLPGLRDAAAALAATALVLAVLFALAGAYAIAAAQFLIPAVCGGAAFLALRRSAVLADLSAPVAGTMRDRLLVLAPVAALTVLLVVVLAASGSDWHSGTGAGALITVFHYRAVYALLVAGVLAVAGAAAAVMIGRTSRDERETARAAEARRAREERERRRREDREAARRRRGAA